LCTEQAATVKDTSNPAPAFMKAIGDKLAPECRDGSRCLVNSLAASLFSLLNENGQGVEAEELVDAIGDAYTDVSQHVLFSFVGWLT
jgi:hypothetical protein